MEIKSREIESLQKLQSYFKDPIYLVGGYFRNYLLSIPTTDIDITGNISSEEIVQVLEEKEYKISDINNSLGTLVIFDKRSKLKFEYTRFRRESYKKGGYHTPSLVEFTSSLEEDATRRDFRCNAIYYNLKDKNVLDPLNGMEDIEKRILRTTRKPEEVFSEDGLRIMRLARFSCELNFEIEEETFIGAKNNVSLLKDISVERITSELESILVSDTKYKGYVDNRDAHYKGLKVLSELGCFKYILPELEMGRGMTQRADFHKYDVLEHSLQTVRYSSKEIRLAALLHDIGKPYCFKTRGVFHFHDLEGEKIIEDILNGKRFRFSKKVISDTKRLTRLHMLDIKNDVKESKLRWYFVINYDILDKLLQLKQADYLGCGKKTDISPTVLKWCEIINRMKKESVPLSLKELKVSALDIKERCKDVEDKYLSKILNELLKRVVQKTIPNEKERLLSQVKGIRANIKGR